MFKHAKQSYYIDHYLELTHRT